MEHPANPPAPSAPRPARQAKTKAIASIREYTVRQMAAKEGRHGDNGLPTEDEYGLIDTDPEDGDYEGPSDTEDSSIGSLEDTDEEEEEEEEEEEDD